MSSFALNCFLGRCFASSNACKRAERGLYAGKTVRFGYSRSDFGNKSRRAWRPNVHRVRLYSESLDQTISIRASTTALKLVDRAGGLDNYLLGQRDPESRRAAELVKQILLRRHETDGSGAGLFEAA